MRPMLLRTAAACSVAAVFVLSTAAADEKQTLAPTCANALVNLGFESGDFTGWTVVDHPQPFVPVANRPAGFTPGFGLFATAPTEGTRVMSTGFDGGTPPSTIRLFQDLVVPRNKLNLQFDYRAGWDMLSFPGSTLPRVFSVDIEPSGGGTPLQTTTILTAPPATQNLDTGPQRGTVPLANFGGQTVRVSFEWLIPEVFTGPAHAQLDNVMPLLPVSLTLNGTGVFEPGDTRNLRPGWLNCSTLAVATTGTATGVTGPAGATYTLVDTAADYGSIPAAGSLDCQAGTGNCYALSISNPPTRPAQHWDAVVTEQLSSPGLKDWAIHVGSSFTDVPASNPFYRFVETLLHFGVTGGCGGTNYCPSTPTTRDQMAVFVLVAKEGAGYTPAACGTPVFPDVPASNPFCRYIEELSRRGVVSGCGGGNYCPTAAVTRDQMSVFALRTLDPTLNPPACTTPVFADVPASNPFCKWIEELARRGVVSGCGGGNYCPTSPVTRDQMGVFISGTFGLTLYGP